MPEKKYIWVIRSSPMENVTFGPRFDRFETLSETPKLFKLRQGESICTQFKKDEMVAYKDAATGQRVEIPKVYTDGKIAAMNFIALVDGYLVEETKKLKRAEALREQVREALKEREERDARGNQAEKIPLR